MTLCDRVAADAAAWVRGDALPDDLAAHTETCPDCRALLDGAAGLRDVLGRWEVEEPPADLTARTLAKIALTPPELSPVDLGEGGEVIPFPARKRSSVEILVGSALPGDHEPIPLQAPSRRDLWSRLLIQSAAAALLVGVCTTFAGAFYPAAVHAWERRHLVECRGHLQELRDAVARYRRERPDAEALRGWELRHALIEGGYLDVTAFTCPSPHGRELLERSYVGQLPPPDPDDPETLPADLPIFWDRFGNHTEGFNVIYGDGRTATVEVDELPRWIAHMR